MTTLLSGGVYRISVDFSDGDLHIAYFQVIENPSPYLQTDLVVRFIGQPTDALVRRLRFQKLNRFFGEILIRHADEDLWVVKLSSLKTQTGKSPYTGLPTHEIEIVPVSLNEALAWAL